MSIDTRQGHLDYCLRSLGHPMIEVNVTDEQLEDRLDEALEFFRLYHYDGIEKIYLKHKITSSSLSITTNNQSEFNPGQLITGQNSGATARIASVLNDTPPDNTLWVNNVTGTFLPSEPVKSETNVECILSLNPLTVGDIDNRWIPIDDWIYGVNRIIPFSSGAMSSSMFSLQYQMRMYDLFDLSSTSIIYYKQMMSHLTMLEMELNGKPSFRFNRLNNRLYLDINWDGILVPGEYIVVECYRAMNPAEYGRVYGELWLKHYTTALIRKQWGQNLASYKFGGLTLPGGVTIEGQTIYDQGLREQKALEQDIMEKQSPLGMLVG